MRSNKEIILGAVAAAELLFPGRNYKELVFNDQSLNGVKCLVLPHPSPVNIAWFKDNPDFEKKGCQKFAVRFVKLLFDFVFHSVRFGIIFS